MHISRFLSQKFRFYTFVCIALLPFVHGYNLNQTYLQPFSSVNEPLNLTTFTEYFLANGLLRFRIPLLFLISGYLHAANDQRPYLLQLKKRAVTLLIPYLLWSAIGLAITYLWQQHPMTATAVRDAAIDQLGDNRSYDAIGWKGVFTRWLFAPVAFQLWFILALFLYDAFYPLLVRVVVRYALPWLVLTALLWAGENSVFVLELRGLFFFSVGIWLQKRDFLPEKKPAWISLYVCWVVFIGFSVIKTFMAFELDADSTVTYWALSVLHAVSVLAGILAVWFGLDKVVRWCCRQPWFIWLSAFSFFIFGLHEPLVIYLTRLSFLLFNAVPGYRLLTYCIVPTLVVALCIALGAVTRRLLPGFYRIATGGRGLKGL